MSIEWHALYRPINIIWRLCNYAHIVEYVWKFISSLSFCCVFFFCLYIFFSMALTLKYVYIYLLSLVFLSLKYDEDALFVNGIVDWHSSNRKKKIGLKCYRGIFWKRFACPNTKIPLHNILFLFLFFFFINGLLLQNKPLIFFLFVYININEEIG